MNVAEPPSSRGGDHRANAVSQLRAIYGIGQAAAAARNDDNLLRFTAAAAREALGASSVSIERFELDQGQVRVLVNDGDLAPSEVELPEHETYPIDQFAAIKVMDDGVPGIVVSLDGDAEVDPSELGLLRDLGKHSSIQVPIRLDGRLWGELYATRAAGMRGFVSTDIELAQAVAAQVASGIAAGAHVRRVSELALLDSLTGLANRAAVEQRLASAVAGHHNDGRTVSVMICDVNGLKRINDERGHPAGDRLLIRVAELLGVAASRLPGSLAGRLGGDEFCLVVEDLPPDTVIDVVTELCRRASTLSGGSGVACGVASTADGVGHVIAPGDLVRLADGAQYHAKRNDIRVPVVAGRPLPDPPRRSTAHRPGPDRRMFRGVHARPVGLAEVIEEVVSLLDHAESTDAAERLALVGDAVTRLVDASSWWVSDAALDDSVLTDRRHGAYRAPRVTGPDRDSFFTPGEPVDLVDYPASLRAIGGGWFEAAVDDEAADPRERAMLLHGGYTAVVAAGGRGAGRNWLLEIFTDSDSRPVPGLGPALRALVALALTGSDRRFTDA